MPFNIICPASRGLSLSLARTLLLRTPHPLIATTRSDPGDLHETILSTLPSIDPSRLSTLQVDVTDEAMLLAAAHQIPLLHPHDHAQYIFSTPGVLHPERTPADLHPEDILHTLQTNLVGPLLTLKHLSPFLPTLRTKQYQDAAPPSVWVSISARVGSIGGNRVGGWYSYRASKAGLNQAVKTLDVWLEQKSGRRAMAVCVHPGSVKTGLSREFWAGAEKRGELQSPDEAAGRVLDVVMGLGVNEGRGGFWDHKGKRIEW